jgi:16S rRNA C1402 (ribose-2'-O) methylase RsmI
VIEIMNKDELIVGRELYSKAQEEIRNSLREEIRNEVIEELRREKSETVCCSFCEKDQEEVEKLVNYSPINWRSFSLHRAVYQPALHEGSFRAS